MSADVETVGTVLLAGAMVGEAALENLKKRKRAPSSAKRSRLEENRRLWVTTSAPSGPGGSLPPPPPSGVYSAEYSERGCKGRSSYDLQFVDGRVIGKGSDDDGEFVIDGGVYDSLSGRAAWGEWTKSTGLYSEVKLQCGEGTLSGKYKSNLGMAGELELKFFGSVVTPSNEDEQEDEWDYATWGVSSKDETEVEQGGTVSVLVEAAAASGDDGAAGCTDDDDSHRMLMLDVGANDHGHDDNG